MTRLIVVRDKLKKLPSSVKRRLDLVRDANTYKISLAQLATTRADRQAKLAVVVHLYYVDTWPLIHQHLQALSSQSYDLYVTIPQSMPAYAEIVKKDLPTACVIKVPNRGRDVLPFMKLLPELEASGHECVLKLHSKKSTHRDFLSNWMDELVSSLLPTDRLILDELFVKLAEGSTGLIGPKGHYLSLPVNYAANSTHIKNLLTAIISSETAARIDEHPADYGFFAGTMFWARIDALKHVYNFASNIDFYEDEAGQIDGTFAHAIERVLCLGSELEGKHLYEIDNKAINEISYSSGIIPEWSELHPSNES